MSETVAFPQDRTCPYQPAPGYRSLAEQRPLSRITLYDGREAWAVTGYALTRELLADPRISSDHSNPSWPVANAAAAAALNFSADQKKIIGMLTALVGVDGPEHGARREIAEACFTPGLIDALRPRIQAVVDRHVDGLIAGGAPADLVGAFASPVALAALYETLGIPDEDREYFERKTKVLFGPDAVAVHEELVAYVAGLVERRPHTPGESLLDTLVSLHAERGTPAADVPAEILQMLLIMVVSGHHATSSSISIGVNALLHHPERLGELRSNPALVPAAVDELARLVAVTDGVQRVAAEDIEVEDTVISEGDGVFFVLSLINRDHEYYAGPDALDWHRPEPGDHVSYGFGPHRCVGMDVAHAILEITFRTVIERLPGLRLATAAEDTSVTPGETFQGLVELKVIW